MDKDTKGGYYLYDINTKLNHRFSDRDRLFFSFYHGKDHASFTNTSSYYFEEEKETDTRERQVMAWGLSLIHIFMLTIAKTILKNTGKRNKRVPNATITQIKFWKLFLRILQGG